MKRIKSKTRSLEDSLKPMVPPNWGTGQVFDGLGEFIAPLGDWHPIRNADVSGHFVWYMIARAQEKEAAQ